MLLSKVIRLVGMFIKVFTLENKVTNYIDFWKKDCPMLKK